MYNKKQREIIAAEGRRRIVAGEELDAQFKKKVKTALVDDAMEELVKPEYHDLLLALARSPGPNKRRTRRGR